MQYKENGLISLKNVYKTYRVGENKVRALSNINLNVKEGEFVAIVGASGSGKSTLMNIIGCLDIANKGKYYLDDIDIEVLTDDELSKIRNEKIGFIFQGFNLIPGLTALENVELPLMYRRLKKQERHTLALNALKKVGLTERVNHLPSMMSGGQQQRVAIARAIAISPPIILADEPTGNLDTKVGNTILKILIDLNKEGKTIVLITHDMNIAKQATRIIRVSDGAIKNQEFVTVIE